MTLRPAWQTIRRVVGRHPIWTGLGQLGPVIAGAAREGQCPSCSDSIKKGDTIVYISDEWVCGICGGL